MTEQELWKKLDAVMRNTWDAQRHEDALQPDIPDVSYAMRGTGGWIELKAEDRVGQQPVPIPHLRPGQVNWMRRRSQHGSPCFIGWATRGEFLLIGAEAVASHTEARTADEWRAIAAGIAPLDDRRKLKEMLTATLAPR